MPARRQPPRRKAARSAKRAPARRPARTSRPRARPSPQDEELQPLDLEGFDDPPEPVAVEVPVDEKLEVAAPDEDFEEVEEKELFEDEFELPGSTTDEPPLHEDIGSTPTILREDEIPGEAWVMQSATPTAPPVPAETEVERPVIERPAVELGVALIAAALAASVFLPWYTTGIAKISGWSSGTWGPIIFFLAVVVITLVVLRRAGVVITFPVEVPLVLEGIGWLSVIALLLKRYFRPKVAGFDVAISNYLYIALFIAIGLAVTAGFVATNTPFVLRPGWLRTASGKAGAAMLVVALAAGVSLGFTVGPSAARTANSSAGYKRVSGLPPCAKKMKLPIPPGFTPQTGFEPTAKERLRTCGVTMTAKLGANTALKRYEKALTEAHWRYQERIVGQTSALYLTAPSCGPVVFAPNPQVKLLQVSVFIGPCTAPNNR